MLVVSFFSALEYDDILLPNSVKTRVEYLQKHLDCAVVAADAWVVHENNLNERNKTLAGDNPNRYDRNHFFQCLRSRTIFNAACLLIRTKEFDITHPDRHFFPSRMGPNQQILLPLYYHWNRGFLEEPQSLFLVRDNSVSHEPLSVEDEVARLGEYRLLRVKTLESIKMLEEDRQLYIRQVNILYNKSLLLLAFSSNNKYLFLYHMKLLIN